MSFRTKPWKGLAALALVAAAALALSPALLAQELIGNIYGTVADEQGGRLPGVSVTLTGIGAAQTATSDSKGEYHFLNLSPGNYSVVCELQGFAKVTKTDVQVAVGKDTNVSTTMKLSSVEAAVTVRGETALLDTHKVTTGAVIDKVELNEIPTARDPWVVLQSVPGVLTDRLNIGGDQSGQQSFYIGKGAMSFNNVWNLDGVNITDMAATGSTGTYYDFDSFEEINATTGGADITQMTPGVQLNLVTKRGTNDIHGSTRAYDTRDQWQSNNISSEDKAQGLTSATRISEVQDYGAEVGGPIWRDHAWAWGAYGRNQVDLIQIGGTSDKTTLIDANAKINIQPIESTSVNFTYTQGEKDKFGRNSSLTRPQATSWDQGGFDGAPSANMKAEVSQVFSSALFATANYSYFRGGFELIPEGSPIGSGLSVNNTFLDINAGGVWNNSYLGELIDRPVHNVGGNGSFFFNTGSIGNELKFGFSYRKAKAATTVTWPGQGNWLIDLGGAVNEAVMTRPAYEVAVANYYNGYIGDVITAGNLTVNAGVRYDVQNGYNVGATVAANPIIPDLMPALSPPTSGTQVDWKDWQPRIGLTYAVGPAKKLLVKASYARFVDQLGFSDIEQTNAAALAGEYFYTSTQPGQPITRASLDFNTGFPCGSVNCQGFYGFDPANPTSTVSPNFISPNFKAGKTDEGILGFDYEVIPEFVVGAAYTYRKYTGEAAAFPNDVNGNLYTSADWTTAGAATLTNKGVTYTIPNVFILTAPRFTGSTELDRPDYNTTYNGVELTFQKRLSNKWMVRGNLNYQDWKQSGGAASCVDPNNVENYAEGGSCPGSTIMMQGAGSGSGSFSNVWVNSKWNFNILGLYQLPMGFNVGGNFYGRQGYPRLSWIAFNTGDGVTTPGVTSSSQNILVGGLDGQRYPNLYNFDFRLEKALDVKPLQVSLSIDVFNVINSGTVLQRLSQFGRGTCTVAAGCTTTPTASYGTISEIQSPRVVRAGARVSF